MNKLETVTMTKDGGYYIVRRRYNNPILEAIHNRDFGTRVYTYRTQRGAEARVKKIVDTVGETFINVEKN